MASNVGNVEEALNHSVESIGIGRCQGRDICAEPVLVCYLTLIELTDISEQVSYHEMQQLEVGTNRKSGDVSDNRRGNRT